jgi:hypothetical protein
MLNDSWAGRNPTKVVVPIEEEEEGFKYWNSSLRMVADRRNM